jgi:hypothetical protein
MKATDSGTSADSQAADTQKSAATPTEPSSGATFNVTDEATKEWIGRPVYSRDGAKLGEIAALQRDSNTTVTELDADMGGFLGFGATRVRITSDQIQEAKDDGVVLTLTEAEAKNLPAIETE